jgi:hypothetical protein
MTQSLKPQPADGRSRTRESSGPEVSRLLLRERSNWPQYSFLIAVLATIGLAVAGCGGDATSGGPASIIVSGDTAGWIVPCGCAVNQSGGLPRRGSFISRAVHDADVLYLDAGGAPGGTSAYDQLKFRYILEGERAMGLAVHNGGAAELALGADTLRRLARQTQVNFLCANAFDANGNAIGEPWTAVDVAGRAVLVVGVISETFAGPDVSIVAPRRRILEVLDDRAGADDFIVVLAYVPEDELRELAGNLPEVDLIVGGPTGQAIAPVRLGPTTLAAATNKGKFLIRVDLPSAGDPGPPLAEVVEMDESWDDDATQMSNLDRFRAALAKADFGPGETEFAPTLPAQLPEDYRVAGTQTCRTCHAADCTVWDAGGHAHAWATLEKSEAQVDPYCQQCHTTGYGLPGGFVSANTSPGLTDVGCESCHGPSAGHVAKPEVRTAYYEQARNHCLKCHDHDNSPDFDYTTYWPRIEHGDKTESGASDSSTVE